MIVYESLPPCTKPYTIEQLLPHSHWLTSCALVSSVVQLSHTLTARQTSRVCLLRHPDAYESSGLSQMMYDVQARIMRCRVGSDKQREHIQRMLGANSADVYDMGDFLVTRSGAVAQRVVNASFNVYPHVRIGDNVSVYHENKGVNGEVVDVYGDAVVVRKHADGVELTVSRYAVFRIII